MHAKMVVSLLLAMSFGCHGAAHETCAAAPEPASGAERSEARNTTFEADIRELLELTHAVQLGQQMAAPVMQALVKAYPQVPQSVWQQLTAGLSGETLTTLVVDVYKEHLTQEDVRAMIAFYSTPSGRRVIEKMPVVMQAAQLAGQQWAQEAISKMVLEAKRQGYQL